MQTSSDAVGTPVGAHMSGSDHNPSTAAAHDLVHVGVAPVTVRVVLPETAPSVASMLLVPGATPLARPPDVIVATELAAEAQVTLPVRFAVLASLYVPVALNCWLRPAAIEGLAGVTAMLWRVAAAVS